MNTSATRRSARPLRVALATVAFAALAVVGFAAAQPLQRMVQPTPAHARLAMSGEGAHARHGSMLIAPAAAPVSTAAFQARH